MKKLAFLCVACGLVASCADHDGFTYQRSTKDNTITVTAKSGHLDSKNANIIVLARPSVIVTDETTTGTYVASGGQLNIKNNELLLHGNVLGHSGGGNTVTADKMNIKL